MDNPKWGQPQAVAGGEPYGCVTTRRVTGQQFFYRHPEPPYLDNASECITVYTAPPAQAVREPLPPVEAMRIVLDIDSKGQYVRGTTNWAVALTRAIEAAHGITKEGGQHD